MEARAQVAKPSDPDAEPAALFQPKEDQHASAAEIVLQTLLSQAKTPPLSDASILNPSEKKRYSIAIILRQSASTPKPPFSFDVLFIQRALRATDPWSGDIAFPGGKREPEDYIDLSVALRETKEEIGIDLSNISNFRFISSLPTRPLYHHVGVSAGLISPFIFLQLEPVEYHLNSQEVASVFWVPLDKLQGTKMRSYKVQTVSRTDRKSMYWMGRMMGEKVRMAAVDVLPHGLDVVHARPALLTRPPRTVLWGISLKCAGDLVHVLGGKRIDFPSFVPDNWAVAALVYFVTDALLRLLVALKSMLPPVSARVRFLS